MTPLDQAFQAAKEDENKRNDFYALLMSSMLYIPTHDIPEEHSQHRASGDTSFRPIIVESDGAVYVMLFDTLEKLTNWTQRPVGYVALPGHVIAGIADSHMHWALNAGTNLTKILVPDEVRWMKESFLSQQDDHVKLNAGTEIYIGEPANIPSGLIAQLTDIISTRNPEIREACLEQVLIQREGEQPHLVLALRIDPASNDTIHAIETDLGNAARPFLQDGTYIDICVDDGTGLARDITNMIAPFYCRVND